MSAACVAVAWALSLTGCGDDGDEGQGGAAASGASTSGGTGGSAGTAGSGAAGSGGTGGSAGGGSGPGGSAPHPCAGVLEGYGSQTEGGSQGDLYRVTSLDDGGPNTLREGIEGRSGARTIVFDVGGTITLEQRLTINEPDLTIDGCTAPDPGITLTPASESSRVLLIHGTHDIIVRGLRFVGLWQPGEEHIEGTSLFTLDGDAPPDHVVHHVVVGHMTFRSANDLSFGVWGESHDVTFSWSIIIEGQRGSTISYHPAPFPTMERFSYHHNVHTKTIERNPQIRGDVTGVDFVNNIIHEWGWSDPASGYGTRIGRESEPPVSGNFVNNFYVSSIRPENAFISLHPGEVYFDGNKLPPETVDDFSTVTEPLDVPVDARVTTVPAADLAAVVLPTVGMPYRDSYEASLVEDIEQAMAAAD